MKIPTNRKELEEALRRFFEIDRALPSVMPKNPKSLIGKMIVIPDTERSIEDINEDMQRNRGLLTAEDLLLWETANEWLKKARFLNRLVVKRRCQGMGWKGISRELVNKGISDRHWHRATLWRHFVEGLDEILRKI